MPELSETARVVCQVAANEALSRGYSIMRSEHIMLALCRGEDLYPENLPSELKQFVSRPDESMQELGELQGVFAFAGLDMEKVHATLQRRLGGVPVTAADGGVVHRAQECKEMFSRAEREAVKGELETLHFLIALVGEPLGAVRSVVEEQGADCGGLLKFARAVARDGASASGGRSAAAMSFQQMREHSMKREADKPGYKRGAHGRDGEPGEASLLKKIGRDLTAEARAGKLAPVIGRHAEIRQVAQILLQRRQNNPVLVGDPGVGKTCIVEGLAQLFVGDNAPEQHRDRRIVEITMAGLLAGTKYRGDFEERLQLLIREAEGDPNLVLFIDEIHTLIASGKGGDSGMDAANILKPAMARGTLRCIGATTTAEYRKYIEQDPALERRLQMVWVDEPTREEAVRILRGIRPALEKHYGAKIMDEAIDAAVDLSVKYMTDFRLPDKAIGLIDTAMSRVVMSTVSPGGRDWGGLDNARSLGREQVARVVSDRCRVPLEKMSESYSDRLLRMEEILRRRVMGQDGAVGAVSDAIRTARAGFKNPNKPVGVFLFAGMTGTGKTELAKALAEFLFDDDERLIAIDMSEFMDEGSTNKLIGAPPGYVGYAEEGQLTGRVRTQPYSVVLFDEIEKAHPSVFDLFLQVFDEGRLTDSKGRVVSFKESVVIMTSNLGAREAFEGYGTGGYEQAIDAALRRELRPELLARVGKVVYFRPFEEEHLRLILEKTVGRIRERMAGQELSLELIGPASDALIAQGYSPRNGVRGLERLLEERVVTKVARGVLEGRYRRGDRVTVDFDGNEFVLERAGL